MSARKGRLANGRSRSPTVSRTDPIGVFEHEHMRHREMCDCLEAIADGLPDLVDPRLCASLAAMLRVDLPAHHRREEEVLFPLLQMRAEPDQDVGGMLAQLRREHAIDEGYADELCDLLDSLATGGRPENPDMVGYMLRGFFESYRRHLHWERAIILPLARRLLTDDDLRGLTEQLSTRR
jgi:hemerythrin-like domain-containing protein